MAGSKRPGPVARGGGGGRGAGRGRGGGPKRQKRGTNPLAQDIPLPNDDDNDVVGEAEEDLSDEDLDVLEQFGSAAGFLANLNTKELDKSLHDKQQAATAKASAATAGGARKDKPARDVDVDSEDEEEYERGPRGAAAKVAVSRDRLPVKTLDGQVLYEPDVTTRLRASQLRMRVAGVLIDDDLDAQQEQQKEAEETRKAEEAVKREQLQKQKEREKLRRASLLPAAPAFETPEERQAHMREVMASSAHRLLAAPEENVGELRTLNTLAGDKDGYVARLAMLSLLAVFKDLVPGYRIRLPTDEEQEVKVSKEVQKVRDYETALLRGYQAYLKVLVSGAGVAPGGKGANKKTPPPVNHARVAVRCMCALLTAAPHFNYAGDLLQAVVPRMCSVDLEARRLCCDAVCNVLRADVQGAVALEAVQLVSDLVRRRKCIVPPDVLHVLMVLDFSEVGRGGKPVVGAESDKDGVGGGKGRGKGRGKKKTKEDDVDRSFREADAGPDRAQLAIRQSQMLEALFEVLFRVIKTCTAAGLTGAAPPGAADADEPSGPEASDSGAAEEEGGDGGGARSSESWSRAKLDKKFPLLGPALEGLARFSHLISVEYFEDLMDVFRQLLRCAVLPLVERLRCLQTVADILRGQGEALNVDRREFYTQLYTLLLHELPLATVVCDDGGYRAPSAQDDDDGEDAGATSEIAAAAAQDAHALAPLLAGVVGQMLVEPKITDTARLAAFAKRMASVALCARSGEALSLLAIICKLLRRYHKLTAMLECESGAPVGGRQWDAGCVDPSEAGGLAATLWEVNALARHYHPHVAQAATSLLALAPGAGATAQVTGVLATSSTLLELASAYDTSKGAYRPAPPPPKRRASSALQQQQQRSNRLRRSGNELGPELALALQRGVALGGAGGGGAPATAGRKKAAAAAAAAAAEEDGAAGMAAEALSGEVGDAQLASVAASISQHFRLHRQFQRSAELRQDEALLLRQLHLFKEHLAEQKAAQARQSAADAKAAAAAPPSVALGGKKGKASSAAAGAPAPAALAPKKKLRKP